MSDSVQPYRQQPTRLPHPWDSPGKNTGVGRHFLFQCMKVKSESEVTQSCLTLSHPMDCSLPGSSIHGIFQVDWAYNCGEEDHQDKVPFSSYHIKNVYYQHRSLLKSLLMLAWVTGWDGVRQVSLPAFFLSCTLWKYSIFLYYFNFWGIFGWFQFGAIMSKASPNSCMWIFRWMYIFRSAE